MLIVCFSYWDSRKGYGAPVYRILSKCCKSFLTKLPLNKPLQRLLKVSVFVFGV